MSTTAKTFDPDATLPDLPVPRLEDSIARDQASVRPLLDDETNADVEAAAGGLLEPGSVGRKLHQLLEVTRALHDMRAVLELVPKQAA